MFHSVSVNPVHCSPQHQQKYGIFMTIAPPESAITFKFDSKQLILPLKWLLQSDQYQYHILFLSVHDISK